MNNFLRQEITGKQLLGFFIIILGLVGGLIGGATGFGLLILWGANYENSNPYIIDGVGFCLLLVTLTGFFAPLLPLSILGSFLLSEKCAETIKSHWKKVLLLISITVLFPFFFYYLSGCISSL